MELIQSKLLQRCEHRKRGKYLITLKVTDNDIDMLEDLATGYCTLGTTPECVLKSKYSRWLKKTFRCFWKLWNKYDKY